ncbi:MAG: Oar protein, partial [Edaphobacter sp.]|nr:Oar protein [Edaphobacter sp.]
MMRRTSKIVAVAVAAWFLFSTRILAQTAALPLWQGILRDAGGVPIHGAEVHLKGKSGTFNATTATDGQFRLQLIPGQYQLSVDVNHDKIQYAAPINMTATSPAVVITLSAQKSLSVTSVTDQRQASGGEELSSQTVGVLPLNKRDFSQLLLLAAGTMTDANGATNFTQQFAINGQRGVEAVFAMDGADISDPEMGGSTFSNFNVDAVEEIRSSSGWMPAEIGRGAAGFTNIVTRSGNNGFHGSIFEFVRNSALDARNYFDHATAEHPERIPPFRRNEFGFT